MVIAICVGVYLTGAISIIVAFRLIEGDGFDSEDVVPMALFWPVLLPIMAVIGLGYVVFVTFPAFVANRLKALPRSRRQRATVPPKEMPNWRE